MTDQTTVICPMCQQRYKLATTMLGREVNCPKCMARFEAIAADPPTPPAGHRAKKPFPLYELFLEEPSEQWFALMAGFGPIMLLIAAVLTSEQDPELRLTAWGTVGYSSLWLLLALLLRINATIKSQCRLIRAELKDLPKNNTAPVDKSGGG